MVEWKNIRSKLEIKENLSIHLTQLLSNHLFRLRFCAVMKKAPSVSQLRRTVFCVFQYLVVASLLNVLTNHENRSIIWIMSFTIVCAAAYYHSTEGVQSVRLEWLSFHWFLKPVTVDKCSHQTTPKCSLQDPTLFERELCI